MTPFSDELEKIALSEAALMALLGGGGGVLGGITGALLTEDEGSGRRALRNALLGAGLGAGAGLGGLGLVRAIQAANALRGLPEHATALRGQAQKALVELEETAKIRRALADRASRSWLARLLLPKK